MYFPSRCRRRPWIVTWCLVGLVSALVSAGQDPPRNAGPLPTPAASAALIAALREHFWADRQLDEQYTYIERRRDVRVSKLGKVTLGPVRTFEVYPSTTPGRTYKRLIAVGDVPLAAEELARRDAEHRANMIWEKQRRDQETPSERAERARRDEQRRARQRREVDQAFGAFDIVPVGRERVGGADHPWLRLSLTPRRDAPSNSDLVKRLKKFRGTAWVDEAESQVVKVEMEAIEAVTVGWGLIGRVGRGSRAFYERRKADGLWVPARARLQASGRTLLVRAFELDTEWEWSDYRRHAVEVQIVSPKVQ